MRRAVFIRCVMQKMYQNVIVPIKCELILSMHRLVEDEDNQQNFLVAVLKINPLSAFNPWVMPPPPPKKKKKYLFSTTLWGVM